MSHISQKEFETINLLSITERYNQCVISIALKYFDNQCPNYLNEVFIKAAKSSSSLRNTFQKPQHPLRKTTLIQMSYLSLVRHCRIKSPEKSKEQRI